MPEGDGGRRGTRWPGFDLGGGPGNGRPGGWRFSPWLYLAGLFVLLLVFQNLLAPRPRGIPYSEFIDHVRQDRIVGEVVISSTQVSGTYRAGDREVDFTATLPANWDPTPLQQLLDEHGVTYRFTQPSGLTTFLLTTLLPTLLLFGVLWFFLFRRMGGGAASALSLGRNRVKIYDRKEMKTTFADVAGLDEAVEELREIVDFLKNPKKYQRLGGRIPKGVLLLGPPGCGKTLLARAVAGEANVPFFFMSGSEFVEMFVGLGAARVRELFQQAKEKAPALVFLDEIDTIGKGRVGAIGAGLGAHDEREQTLNQLLVEMDGFDSSKGVIIMAATNRPDVLDPALVRPGRFDRQVVVDRPDLRGREAILRVHTRGVALDPSVDLRVLAARTPGFTGADLANVVNEAALLAARREKDSVTMAELEEAIDRVVAGLERKSRVMSEKEKERVAVHEMGHALVALSCPTADPVHRVSIIPRGAAALGMTMQRPLEDRYLLTQPELEDRLAILLGGRTAEELVFGPVSTGAQNDLERATEIARAMVVEYGMSEKLGPLSFGRDGFRSPDGRVLFPGERPEMSEATAELVDREVARLVNEAHERAARILGERRELLERLSRLLMAREVIEGKELRDYVEGRAEIPEPEPVGAGRAGGGDPRSAPERAETLPLPVAPPRPDPPPSPDPGPGRGAPRDPTPPRPDRDDGP
ncbi:MAG TPA: ATP-dependent zinc metalloprotease FtsH [Actinomycetota bacterium]|nr:ATP-dependent zinc metalloprotease FtsH [Actinomycetota bacterium]